MPDFLPRRDADLFQWTGNFHRYLQEDPGRFSLSGEQAAAYASVYAEFAAFYLRSTRNDARTPAVLTAKDAARARLIRLTRELAAIVRAAPGVGDEQRVCLGLKPRKLKRTRVPRPAAPPRIGVVNVWGQAVTLRLRDAASARPLAKAAGSVGAEVFAFVGEEPPADLSEWWCAVRTTRAVTEVHFEGALPLGTRVWPTARWLGTRGEPGPAADAVTAHLAGGWSMPNAVSRRRAA